MPRIVLVITTFAILLFIAAPSSHAVTVEGVDFAETYQVEDIELHLRGSGLLRYLVFIKAYVGAFYLPPQEDARQALGPTPRRLELEEFNTFYQDVQPGDRYALTYRPGSGTELSLNGTPLGLIAGDDFAAAVFAIWLGTDPIDTDFRDALLGVR